MIDSNMIDRTDFIFVFPSCFIGSFKVRDEF